MGAHCNAHALFMFTHNSYWEVKITLSCFSFFFAIYFFLCLRCVICSSLWKKKNVISMCVPTMLPLANNIEIHFIGGNQFDWQHKRFLRCMCIFMCMCHNFILCQMQTASEIPALGNSVLIFDNTKQPKKRQKLLTFTKPNLLAF